MTKTGRMIGLLILSFFLMGLTSPPTPITKDYRYDDLLGGTEDSVAVWVAPDPANSLLFVTHKKSNQLKAWNLNTQTILHVIGGFNRPNGVAVDQTDGMVYVTDRFNQRIVKYAISDILLGNYTPLLIFGHGIWTSKEPLGVAVYRNGTDVRIYATYIGSTPRFVRVFTPEGVFLSEWNLGTAVLESIHVDSELGNVFVSDEAANNVRAYTLDGTFIRTFGDGLFGGLAPDPEGIVVYKCNLTGYILVSDQGSNEFEIFDRQTFDSLARFKVDQAWDTDGITIMQQSSPAYPFGGFFAQSRDRYVEGVKWERIAAQTGMAVCQ